MKKTTNIQYIHFEELSGRAQKALARANIYTAQDLADFCDKYGIDQLQKLRNGIGPRVFSEIKKCFSEREKNFDIIKDIVYSDKDIQNTPIQLIRSLSDRVKNALVSKGILTIKDLIDFCDRNGISSFLGHGFGERKYYEVRNFLQPTNKHIDEVISELQDFIGLREELTETEMVEILKKASSLLKQKNQDEKAKKERAKINIIKKSTNQKEYK